MITSTTTQISGNFPAGSNNSLSVGRSNIRPKLLSKEQKLSLSVEVNMHPASVPQHEANGVLSSNLDTSEFNSESSVDQAHESVEALDKNESKVADADTTSLCHRRPTRESVLRRLSEALMRRSLTMIDMSQRGLRPSDARLVKLALMQNSSLSVLKLGYNNLGDEGVITLASGIAVHGSLSSLDLGFNSIGDEGCVALCSALLTNRGTLHTLYLSGNAIGEHGALAISDIILKGCGLQRLHLTGNIVGAEGVKAITEAISASQPTHKLLEEEKLSNEDGSNNSPNVSPGINNNKNLSNSNGVQELFLGGTGTGHDGCVAVAKMLEQTSTIRVLSLSNCGLCDDGIQLLADSIKANRDRIPLEALQLSFNNLTCKGTESLMNAVWGSTTLKEIRLDNNSIGDRGTQVVSAVLTSVKTLEKIDLGFNCISAHGMRSLMKAVAENDRLVSISISGNKIDTGSAKAVAYALAYNRSLKSIFLDHCSIGEEGQRHITAGIVSNSGIRLNTIKGFRIGGNAVSLGLPSALENWTNEQVLKFILLMWELMRQEQEASSIEAEIDPLHMLPGEPSTTTFSGPLDPATVVSVAKRAFDSLGDGGSDFITQNITSHQERQFESPVTEDAIMLEANGGNDIPLNSSPSHESINNKKTIDGEATLSSSQNTLKHISSDLPPTGQGNFVGQKLDAATRKKKVVEWLCQNIQLLNDLSHLAFNSTELWRLHQHFFAPVIHCDGYNNFSLKESMGCESNSVSSTQPGSEILSEPFIVSPSINLNGEPMPASEPALNQNLPGEHGYTNCIPMLKRKVSYRFLNEACLNSTTRYDARTENNGMQGPVSKLIEDMSAHSMQPKSKRARRNRSRISYLPRVKVKVDSYLDSCHQKALVLMRQLQYIEKSLLGNIIYPLDHSLPTKYLAGSLADDAELILLDMM